MNKDIEKSIYYHKIAANLNHIESVYYLGVIHFQNEEYGDAIKYFEIASNQNHIQSIHNLGILYYKEFKGITQNKELALKYFEKEIELKKKK